MRYETVILLSECKNKIVYDGKIGIQRDIHTGDVKDSSRIDMHYFIIQEKKRTF